VCGGAVCLGIVRTTKLGFPIGSFGSIVVNMCLCGFEWVEVVDRGAWGLPLWPWCPIVSIVVNMCLGLWF
jgi:hypothetical protein